MNTNKLITEIIKKFNYPIFLFAIVSLFNILSIVSYIVMFIESMINGNMAVVSYLFPSFILLFVPVATFVLLWLHKNNNYKKSKKIISIVFAIATLVQVYAFVRDVHVFLEFGFGHVFLFLTFLTFLTSFLGVLLFAIISFLLFCDIKEYPVYYIVLGMYIIITIVSGIISLGSGGVFSSILSTIESLIYMNALWNLPKAFE